MSACLVFWPARWAVSLALRCLCLGLGKVSQVTMPGGWKLCLCPSGTLDCSRCFSGTQRRQSVCESTHACGMFAVSAAEPHPLRAGGNLNLTLAMSTSEMHFSGSRNSSFLTLPARSCSPKCWINWQVVCCFFLPTSTTPFPPALPPVALPEGIPWAIRSSQAGSFEGHPSQLGLWALDK